MSASVVKDVREAIGSNILDVLLSKERLREIGDTVTAHHLNEDIRISLLFDWNDCILTITSDMFSLRLCIVVIAVPSV